MSYRVILSREAEKILDRADRKVERRIRARFRQLAEDPLEPHLSQPLTGIPGVRKSRIGRFRILFTVNSDSKEIYIATIGSRGQVYRGI